MQGSPPHTSGCESIPGKVPLSSSTAHFRMSSFSPSGTEFNSASNSCRLATPLLSQDFVAGDKLALDLSLPKTSAGYPNPVGLPSVSGARTTSFHSTSLNAARSLPPVSEIGGGDEELVLQSDKDKWGPRWLGDNSALFNGGSTAYRLSLSGATQPVLLFDSGFDISTPVVTSDGRWAAYMSKESGRPEIHVATFPSFKQKRQVSNGGGCAPHWRKDGKELFYLGLDGKMRSVDLKGESALETSPPRVLFQTGLPVDADSEPYEVTGDGKRFLYGEPVGENNVSITVVLNWAAGLKR
jgi:hypothetical protein